jgi:hypothetical protein
MGAAVADVEANESQKVFPSLSGWKVRSVVEI